MADNPGLFSTFSIRRNNSFNFRWKIKVHSNIPTIMYKYKLNDISFQKRNTKALFITLFLLASGFSISIFKSEIFSGEEKRLWPMCSRDTSSRAGLERAERTAYPAAPQNGICCQYNQVCITLAALFDLTVFVWSYAAEVFMPLWLKNFQTIAVA